MSDAPACTLREADKALFDLSALDLAGCTYLSIHTALNEFERKREGLGHRLETWPAEVQKRIGDELAAWQTRNVARSIRLVSTALFQGVAILIVHHVER